MTTEKPKRGRRPKALAHQDAADIESMTTVVGPNDPTPNDLVNAGKPAAAPARKSMRKPRVLGTFDSSTGAQGSSFTSDDENVIMKLSVAVNHPTLHTPDPYNKTMDAVYETQPQPCNTDAMDASFQVVLTPGRGGDNNAYGGMVVPPPPHPPPSSSSCSDATAPPLQHDVTAASSSSGAAPPPAPSSGHLRVIRLLTEFEEKSKSGEWPSSTCVHCYWCCHRFTGAPYGLPIKYANDQFQVVGCFCSLECACAFNFQSRESVDECLNRYSLVNMLAHRLGLGRHVRSAPDRLALKIFGGHLSIEEFREFTNNPKQIIVNAPPMVTITQQVEEVHENDMRSEYKYIPIDTDRVTRYQEKIRLKRTKPLVNFKNTLDHTMKLKYSSASSTPGAHAPPPPQQD